MMADPKPVRDAFGTASDFLNPEIKKSQGLSLLEILSGPSDASADSPHVDRTAVIGTALDILTRIHTAFVSPTEEQDEPEELGEGNLDPNLEDAKRRRMLHALLDLISLEGIYPSLSSGVGIPLQKRVISVLPAGVIAKPEYTPTSTAPQDATLLHRIMGVLLSITLDSRPSIQPLIRGRILSDLISGTADLAFNPNFVSDDRVDFQKQFTKIIDDTPTPTLLPTMSAFLQSDIVGWFRSAVSSHIAQVPLRPDGVFQTILFIASQFSPSPGPEAQAEPASGPHLTVQAIMQISRLLSSVPQGHDPASYFTTIAPQLLRLLDGEDVDMRKTVSYVIGSGILGKRAYGAPGTIGHSIFVAPVFAALTGELDEASRRWMIQATENHTPASSGKSDRNGDVIVDSAMVHLAIERLRTLALQHPNPGLVKRIVYPILLPLWGLAWYSQDQQLKETHEKTMALLQTYFSISVGPQPLKKLADNLLWDGGVSWTYTTDSQGQVALKRRTEPLGEQSNLIKLIDSLNTRTELFTQLLGSDPNGEERTGDMFLYVSQHWLVPDQETKDAPKAQRIGEGDNIIQKMVYAKIAEKLLENFKDTLTRRPLRVLELIKQIITGELQRLVGKATTKQQRESGKPSLSSLGNIVSDEKEDEDTSAKEASESLSTAFSLLSTVLASAEFFPTPEIIPLLESIKDTLDRLVHILPTTLSKPATTASMLLEIQLTSPERDQTQPVPQHVSDLETHRQALANLNSNLPPTQAEGFSLLSTLVMKSSPVLDIPATLTLLISIITDISESAANEEFIYLNAIKLIGTLASRHPRTVVKTLAETYTDRSEHRTLDQRLKIGESILRTVQDLSDALAGETAKILGESMITVAGRRGHKPQAQKAKRQEEEAEKRRKERKERPPRDPVLPPGLSIPEFAKKVQKPIEDLLKDDSETESPETTAHATNVVAAWAAGAPADEEPDDLRVRASALSILASAVQTNILGLGAGIVRSAVDLALATLTLEPAVESAILRRNSAVLILDILKAFETARESRRGGDVGFGFSLTDDASGFSTGQSAGGPSTVGNIPSMLRTLGFVESREEDPIVRGHLRALIESLEAWAEKSLLWGIGMGDGDDGNEPRLELGNSIAGLSVNPMAGQSDGGRARIEEIE